MSVKSTYDYKQEPRDKVENFHGNQVVYFHWEEHLSFCAAIAFPLPPDMPWKAVLGELLPDHYGSHPDFDEIEWFDVRWQLNGEEWEPDPEKSLKELGVDHKSLIRFWTPGLDGYKGSSS